MDIKVSVIIPVYNCEKYIKECIESLLNQSLKKCEFIFVNDGSSDKSYDIIKKYEKLDNRIKVISQKNQGVSVARNSGVSIAKGEFIGFIDGDDMVDRDYYEVLYKSAKDNDVDIVISNWRTDMSNEAIINFPFKLNVPLNKEYIKNNIYTFLIQNDSFNSVCNKLFRNEIIKEKNIKFPVGIALGEDGRFNMSIFTYSNSAIYIDYCGYLYREVEGSVTRNISNKDYFKRTLQVYKENIKEINQWDIDKELIEKLRVKKFINSVLSYTYLYFNASNDLKLSKRYKYVRNMIKTKEVEEAFKVYKSDIYEGKGRYDKTVLMCIEKGVTSGIFLSTLYSRLKNK